MTGRYCVQIWLAQLLVVEIDDLVVAPGATVRPPGLQNLALSDQFKEVEIRMIDLEGEAVRGAKVELMDSDRSIEGLFYAHRAQTDARGIARLIVRRHDPVRIRCSAPLEWRNTIPTLREQFFTNPEFPLTVTMRPVPELRCRFSRPLPVLSFGQWRLTLTRPRTRPEIESDTKVGLASRPVVVAFPKPQPDRSLVVIPVYSGEPVTWNLELSAPGWRRRGESLILTTLHGPLDGDISLSIEITDEIHEQLTALAESH